MNMIYQLKLLFKCPTIAPHFDCWTDMFCVTNDFERHVTLPAPNSIMMITVVGVVGNWKKKKATVLAVQLQGCQLSFICLE